MNELIQRVWSETAEMEGEDRTPKNVTFRIPAEERTATRDVHEKLGVGGITKVIEDSSSK